MTLTEKKSRKNNNFLIKSLIDLTGLGLQILTRPSRPTVVERSNALIRWIVDEGEGSNPRHARLSFDCSMNQEQ